MSFTGSSPPPQKIYIYFSPKYRKLGTILYSFVSNLHIDNQVSLKSHNKSHVSYGYDNKNTMMTKVIWIMDLVMVKNACISTARKAVGKVITNRSDTLIQRSQRRSDTLGLQG